MSKLVINGGKKLNGVWRLSGSKNEILPLVAASCFFKSGLELKNVPDIQDARVMMEIAKSLGVEITKRNGIFQFIAPQAIGREIPLESASKVRGSLLFLAPLLVIHGRVVVPRSGGDKIGLRKIDAHMEVFEAFGCKISGHAITLPKLPFWSKKSVTVWLSEPSVTATENALMLASCRPGQTVIKNAASEPHVTALGVVLEKAGAKIDGLGTNRVTVNGVKNFKSASHAIGEDYLELGSVLVLSAVYPEVKVKISQAENYDKIFDVFRKLGKKVTVKNNIAGVVSLTRKGQKTIEEISDGPWPNFPSDLISPLVVLATQSRGQFLFHEKMYESRMYFTDKLRDLGAKLVLCDPHRVLVAGPTKLIGTHLTSPDIRAGIASVIAALVAKGTSVIENVDQLDRGYENLDDKLRAIGADVRREG